MALTLQARRPSPLLLWQSSIGKKAVMAATGLLMVLFLLLHAVGNLKIFFGPGDFNAYAHWLRTIGEPALHQSWYLWVQRTVLSAAVVLHFTAAYQLTQRDRRSRPVRYRHAQKVKASFATRTMRWGGVILLLFIVWHLLDLSAGVVNPDYHEGDVYGNVVADFSHWWSNVIYIVAMLALGIHINHGFWSAAQTLGADASGRASALKVTGSVLAVVITAAFIAVPIGVMSGLVS